jgi:hypothetical protein
LRRAAAVLALLVLGRPLGAAAPGYTVRYRSASAVYLDAGRGQGLNLNDRLAVVAGSETVGELEVVYLAEHSASCRVVSEKRTIRAGDLAVPIRKGEAAPAPAPEPAVPATTPPPVAPLPAAPTTSFKPPAVPWARLRGGFALGLARVWDQTPSDYDFEQRTGRADLGLWDIGGKPFSANVRFRSRQDVRARRLSARSPRDERDDRLYEASLRYEPPGDGFSFELGRIGTSHLVGLSYLDGALVRARVAGPFQLGGFFGQRADVYGYGTPRAPGRKYGAFLRLAPGGRYAPSGFESELAYVYEGASGDVSREYLSLETRYGAGRHFLFYGRGELDLNRGWRSELAEQAYQLSNLQASASWRFKTSSSFVVSYDGYRNYRNHLNRALPEDVFDDLLHRGLRASLFLGGSRGLSVRAGAGVRLREEQDAVNAYSYSLGLRHGDVFGSGIGAGLDGSAFTNAFSDGYLLTAQLDRPFGSGHSLDASFGRSTYRVKATGDDRVTQWLRLFARFQLPRGLYVVGDVEYDRGDDLRGPRALVELGCQF